MTLKGSGAREIEQPLEPDRPFIIDLMADALPDMDDELSKPTGGGCAETSPHMIDVN